jgi:signal transduction histidine kinase
MNIYSVPMLISGILCTLLSVVTWLFRRRESINRVFSFFTLALALDAFAFFMWFQFGSVEHIDTWMRITFTAGFVVPTGLIFFFFAFTGYDKRMDARVLGIKVKHFQISILLFILVCTLLAQFTNLLIRISETPEDIWDIEFGPIGVTMFPLYAGIFIYLFVMAFKGYRITDNKPQKRFILLLAVGTGLWLLFGYVGALIFPISSEAWNSVSYLGTAMMAVFYFVAIVNYQSDKVHELNLNLERKVEDRTQELKQKNLELEDTLNKLEQMQEQLIVQEKMASLGSLVAGIAHEINTPIGAVSSMYDTLSRTFVKMKSVIEKSFPDEFQKSSQIQSIFKGIEDANKVIRSGTERVTTIVRRLRSFARLDEAEIKTVDIHEGIEDTLILIHHDIKHNITIKKDFGEIPRVSCYPGRLNQVFLNLLVNGTQAIEGKGTISISTRAHDNKVYITFTDDGVGISKENLKRVFDPGYTTRGRGVGTGLGLSISYQIIQEHRGEINVRSELQKGTTFEIVLPLDLEDILEREKRAS